MPVLTSQTEGQHAGEFIIGEVSSGGDISRDSAALTNGQNLVDGTIIGLTAGKIVALSGEIDTAGLINGVAVEGILIGDWDASGGEIAEVPYLKQLAVVDTSLLTFPTETTTGGQAAAVNAELAAKFIVQR